MRHSVDDAIRFILIGGLLGNLVLVVVHLVLSTLPAADADFHLTLSWLGAGCAALLVLGLRLVKP